MINYTYLPIRTQFINQNSNHQPFSVKVGFLPWLDFPTEDIFINKPIQRVCSSSYRGRVILIDLNYSIPDTNCCEHVLPEIFRENHFSVFLAVLYAFLLTSSLGEKFRFKKSENIVDTVTLIYNIRPDTTYWCIRSHVVSITQQQKQNKRYSIPNGQSALTQIYQNKDMYNLSLD